MPVMSTAHVIQLIRGSAKRNIARITDLVAPPHCLACKMPVRDAASLCAPCWRKLVLIEEPCCDRLGLPFAHDEGEGAISAAAIAHPPEWDRARSATVFNETSRELVHALKYGDRHETALLMARLMLRAARPLLEGADALVAVPLHWRRLWRRRFNQSALLARFMAERSGIAFRPELLVRQAATRQQVGLDHEARRRNVRRAFAVPEERIAEVSARHIVLVDDVMTTGATAAAAALALRQAGAARIDVVTFALVIAPQRVHI